MRFKIGNHIYGKWGKRQWKRYLKRFYAIWDKYNLEKELTEEEAKKE